MTTITDPRAITTPSAAHNPWQRRAAVAGGLFVVLTVASTFVAGAPPASDASAAKVTAYFKDHTGAIKASIWLGGLGIMAMLWWLGAMWRILSRAEGERPRLTAVAAISLGGALALAIVSGTFTAAGAQRVDDLGDSTRLLFTLSLIAIAAAGFGISVCLAAVCTLNVRAKVFPAWTNIAGAVAAVAFFVGTTSVTTDANALNIVNLIAFFVWCVWILGVSAAMWSKA